MTRPLLLDLFCKAGGATKGYQRAGFHVIGVDIEPQPRYCGDEFIEDDAMEVLEDLARGYGFGPRNRQPDAIHASPPCQHHANVTAWRGSQDDHPDLLTPALEILTRSRIAIPWIVENVPEALPQWDWLLCGTQFGLKVRRHRGFRRGNWEPLSFELSQPCTCYRNPELLPFMHKNERAFADALGCDWMTGEEGRQAIPPAYTEYLGGLMIEHLAERGAA